MNFLKFVLPIFFIYQKHNGASFKIVDTLNKHTTGEIKIVKIITQLKT